MIGPLTLLLALLAPAAQGAPLPDSAPGGGGFFDPVTLVPGFDVEPEATVTGGFPTQCLFGPDGRLFVAVLQGTVLAFDYGPNGIVGEPQTIASGVGQRLLGIAFDAQGLLYCSSNEDAYDTGFLAQLEDVDGDGFFETERRFVTNLPNKDHDNNQLALRGTTLYFGMGARSDDGSEEVFHPIPSAAVLRVELDQVDFESPDNVPEVHALGLRNAFGIALDQAGQLWVGENARNETITLPDELHRVVPGQHHGYPFETAPEHTVDPVALMGCNVAPVGLDVYPGSGSWGLEFRGDLFVARYNFELNDPLNAGMDVVRVQLDPNGSGAPTGSLTVFADDFVNPIDVEVDPYGNLIVLELFGRIFRIFDGVSTLSADVEQLSVAAGGTQQLQLAASASHASSLFFVLGSASGTQPGLPLGDFVLPLNPDAYLTFTALNPNTLSPASVGVLDIAGKASVALVVPPGTPLEGVVLHHAYALLDPSQGDAVTFVSNAQALAFVP